MFFTILLSCVDAMNGERTISGIHNLLTGKRSSQTLQDSKGYRLDHFFGIYPSLEKKRLKRIFEKLADKQILVIDQHQYPFLVQKGKNFLLQQGTSDFYFSGLRNQQAVQLLKSRFLLLVQTVANVNSGKRNFFPVIEDRKVQLWVKSFYKQHVKNKSNSAFLIYEEMFSLIDDLEDLEAELFTYRLSGGPVIGFTREQLARFCQITIEEVDIRLEHVFHYIYSKLSQSPQSFPKLRYCVDDLHPSSLVTQSSEKTFQFLKHGLSLEEIAGKRNLKVSTIQDHIVEAALVMKNFPIEQFIDYEDQMLIFHAAESLKTMKLKSIYQYLDGRYTYFQLRIVLAKKQHETDQGGSYASAEH
ncbi:helix-turn-helix domain-containing protein [Halobacillus salinarum]|uniref:Helix-turn-helix domain-containing protein n=1 Tax=Halobacillus salinarum TaxID=2932257 RepID=A0ABY4EGD0_9BACI|nr:helix-turn-helix domain-containing protein [Halobacillus salinarum]UOQ42674.1 helix-turn-helix domain-containing protein [Halobacillus salinarum]